MSQERFIRIKEVIAITGLSRSTIYAMIASRSFPKQRRIGARAIAFRSSEINAWVNARGVALHG